MEGEKFKPIDLTEENVEKLYEICQATRDSKAIYSTNLIFEDKSDKIWIFH